MTDDMAHLGGAMERRTILDDDGTFLGRILTLSDGEVGYDSRHRIIGYYDATTDTTTDHNEHVVGQGNLLVAIITKGR